MRPTAAFQMYLYAVSDYRETANVLQFLRMLPRGIKAKVVQVEYVDNGDLNIQYNEKKKYLMSRGGDCKEFFVSHGTDGKQIYHTARPSVRPSSHPPMHLVRTSYRLSVVVCGRKSDVNVNFGRQRGSQTSKQISFRVIACK